MRLFRTYQVFWNRISQLLDAIIVMVSFVLAWYIKFHSGLLQYGGHYSLGYYFPVMLAGVPAFLVSNWVVGLYKPMRLRSFLRITLTIVRSLAVGLLLFMSFLYFIHISQFSRAVLGIFALCYTALSYTKYIGMVVILRIMRSRGYNKKFVLIAGWTTAATRFLSNLESYPWFGYHVLGYLNDTEVNGSIPYLGQLSKLSDAIEANLVDSVLVCLPRDNVVRMPEILAQCDAHGIQSLILPDYFDVLPANPRFENFAGMPLIDTRHVPLDDALNAFLKRLFDVVFSFTALLLLSPLLLLISTTVRLSSPGPILFGQERLGRNRRPFTMYKFRTMNHNPTVSAKEDPGWTVPNDPRRTAFGKLLRRTSLDELPQFWNVLIGDMSVIGPRPERSGFVEQFRDEVPRYMIKHRVRPGITGWAQVNGWRGNTSIERRIEYDLEYIENWSVWLDIRIVFRTIRNGFWNQNAY